MQTLPLPYYLAPTGASFESREHFLDSTVSVCSTQSHLDYAGIPLTSLGENGYALPAPELHSFVIGDSGSGKTRRVILPTIRLLAKTGQSMILSDSKGELYRAAAPALRAHGYEVRVLNFRDPARGDRWNPLSTVEALYRAGETGKALQSLQDIANAIAAEQARNTKDIFWPNAAAEYFCGLSLLLLETAPEGALTFENIAGLSITGGAKRCETLRQLVDRFPPLHQVSRNLRTVLTAPEGTQNSILSVFYNIISPYTRQKELMDMLSASDFPLEDAGTRSMAVFLILPDDSKAFYPIATLFVQQIYSALVAQADASLQGKLAVPTNFILDEFANFAVIPDFDSILTASRSRDIRFVLVCQSMGQLYERYQSYNAETIMTNCRLWLYLSCRDLPFLERLERLLGNCRSPYTGESEPLVSVEQLQHLDPGEVLLLHDRCRPMDGYLPDISEYDFGEEDFPPAEPPAKREDAPRIVVSADELLERTSVLDVNALKQRLQNSLHGKGGKP